MKACKTGFTLIELLVVLTVMATLLSIVAPRYMDSLAKAEEAALKTNLRLTREAIDQFKEDKNRYPRDLQELVDERYIRNLPVDPITKQDDSWLLVPGTLTEPSATAGAGIRDIHSGAPGLGRDGSPYKDW